MTPQDRLNRIEALLRGMKDKDPAAQQAWEAVTKPDGSRYTRDISDLPEGAVRGLLLLHVASDLSLWRPSVVCAEFYTPAAEIAAALIAALEARKDMSCESVELVRHNPLPEGEP